MSSLNDWFDTSNPIECFAFASPFIYAGIVGLTYVVKWAGLVGPKSTTFHNNNMIVQSSVLLGLTGYTYYATAIRAELPATSFLEICKQTAFNHRQNQSMSPVLNMFLMSKVFEWYDTVLLILNGKRPIWLHLWHHATIGVAFYTGFFTDAVIWIGGLNSFIHIIMYAYYNSVPGIKRFARYLTQLQIVQLFGGAVMNYIALKGTDEIRYRMFSKINMFICLSYGFMFLQFYGKKYESKKRDNANDVSQQLVANRSGVQHPTPKPKYIIIGERKYDITHFKHPGGSVIDYMTNGQDATEAYREFHQRSKRADAVLRSLPSEPVARPSDDREILENFTKFRQQLVDEGFFKPDIPMLCYRILEQTTLFAMGVYLSRHSWIGTACVMGLFRARSGWIQHEGGHNSLTGIMWVDKLIQEIYIGFGLHSCGSMWNKMHNKHHATPQKSKYDIDLDTTPLVAFYDTAVESNRRKEFSRLWLRFQAYTFLPITSGMFVPLFWATYLHPRQALQDKNFRQMFFMLASHLVPPIIFCTWGRMSIGLALLTHFVATWLSDMYLFGHFSLSHTFTDVIEQDENPSWVRYATEHSVDIAVGNPVVDWVMGYLNYQVIHHLFPSMPQHRGPQVSIRWSKFCDQNGLSYTRLGYFEAWKKMFENLNRVGTVYQQKEIKFD